ncbi:MAG: glycosyltransferase family 2 protein [Saprospiraceae bacterium]|nr:glycosyltransferase family 2 protein [Saprospiraceae bacterium]
MYLDKKVAVVLPAYNAGKTLEATYKEIPFDIVDLIILCDDASTDDTIKVAADLGIAHIVRHDINRGYGANQKSLYQYALAQDADIIVMLHPDYQYTPKLILAMVSLIGQGLFEVVLGSRILGTGALKGGMPVYKYLANRLLTFMQNILNGHKLSEYHTGYRAYDQSVLQKIPFEQNSDDFVFDNEVLSQIIYADYRIGEITCPARYEEASSSINFRRSIKYGLGVVRVSIMHWLQDRKLAGFRMYTMNKEP